MKLTKEMKKALAEAAKQAYTDKEIILGLLLEDLYLGVMDVDAGPRGQYIIKENKRNG